ncbi:MAG TPA: acireductone synthase [Terracidiphilus sp.]|jgi:2,3-diketo-5-methylthio-1-phosphopentane phosphatase|nr:acireductone synthase [Terracidiphilus sp.]
MMQPKLYLLDVEGTVAPISFVTEQLFPYARAHFAAFLTQNFNQPAVRADLALLAEEHRAEADPGVPPISTACRRAANGLPGFVSGSIAYVLWLMDRDRKSTALKSLQGTIWKAGYKTGELRSTLFPDVPEAFARWSQSARIAIYSSGSVEAQQLLFRYSNFGDLTPLIAGYFDTRVGPKQASASYAAIATAMNVAPQDAQFFSDTVSELDAAREAGWQTRLVIRPGNAAIDDAHEHARLETFDAG